MSILDKFTLRSFIVISGWIALLLGIAYASYKEPSKIVDAFDTLIGAALTIINIAIARWLFKEGE